MPNLYLKQDTPQGQSFGLRDEHHQIKQVGRFFPHKPTVVEDKHIATRLLKTYPRHLGDWDKNKAKIKAELAERRETRRRKEMELAQNRGQARGPARMAQFVPAKPKPAGPAYDEEVPEEELDNQIEMGDDAPMPDHEPNEDAGETPES